MEKLPEIFSHSIRLTLELSRVIQHNLERGMNSLHLIAQKTERRMNVHQLIESRSFDEAFRSDSSRVPLCLLSGMANIIFNGVVRKSIRFLPCSAEEFVWFYF